MIPAGALCNVAREQNDSIKCTYTGSDREKYALLNVKVIGAKPGASYILQLTNAQGKTQKEIFNVKNGDYRFEYVTAGDVMIRVIEDMNSNGKWDSGDMVLMRQPERSEIYKNEEGVELIATKANWEYDVEVDMSKLFAPITMESVIQMLNDREDERLKKLAEDMAKKRKEQNNNQNQGQSGFGFGGGGLGGSMGGLGGGMGGLGGGMGGGLRSGTGNMNMR